MWPHATLDEWRWAKLKKVIVIGSPGAGKSVFARKLSQVTGLPLTHLDMVWHRPNKTHIPRGEFDSFLEEKFREECWILDGDYSRTLELRFENADTVFFLDYPADLCLLCINDRIGKTRPDMPWVDDCVDGGFRREVEAYPRDRRPRVYELIETYKQGRRIFIFKCRAEAQSWLDSLAEREADA